MPIISVPAAADAPLFALACPKADVPRGVADAARLLLPHLERGQRIDAVALRNAMERTFGGSDAAGAWDWKAAYDACEAATVLFLRKFGPAIRAQAASPVGILQMLGKVASLLPTHTRRSQESQALQQFSTPIELAFAAATAAAVGPADVVLEPSAGSGLLAIFAELAGSRLVLNELAEARAGLLNQLFAGVSTTHWERADRAVFGEAWERELAEIPPFTDSDVHIVTGLLLPIWKRLPDESMRVYRLQTDGSERVIGRLVSPAWVAQAVSAEGVSITPADAWSALLHGRTILELQDGLSLRRAKVMGLFRVELCGFTEGMVDRLKAMGLISEIITWKLRLFVPTGASGPAILAELMDRYPLVRIADR